MTSRPAATRHFENLLNFRDVAESVNAFSRDIKLKPGLFFRSARPDEATAADREQLVRYYGVKTIIDLRTVTEHIEAAKKFSNAAQLTQPAVVPLSVDAFASEVEIPGVRYAKVNLNGKGFERSLVWQLKYLSLAKVVALMAFGYRLEAISIIGAEVLQPRGLIGLGIDTIEHSQQEIRTLFEILAQKDVWPLNIHCTQGKDRTGLTVVLVLLLCGINMAAITHDYVVSETELESGKEERMKEIASIGLDESFAMCPAEFPARILEHITTKYGSITDYMEHIGFSATQISALRDILVER